MEALVNFAVETFDKLDIAVNISSLLGSVGFPGTGACTAIKHWIVGLTKTAVLEYSVKNIRKNAVGPGLINIALINALDTKSKEQVVALHPMSRLGKREEVAELILWLGSDKSSFVTSSYYPIDDGYLAR